MAKQTTIERQNELERAAQASVDAVKAPPPPLPRARTTQEVIDERRAVEDSILNYPGQSTGAVQQAQAQGAKKTR